MSRIQVVSQVGLCSIGFDEARLAVDIDMRPSGSLDDWLQRRGRTKRVFPSRPGDRAYQERGISELRGAVRVKQNPCYVLPCGGGKSFTACKVSASAGIKGRGVGILTVRRILVDDMSSRLRAFGVPHGIIMAGREDNEHRTKIASVHTVAERGLTLDVDLLFVDEAHQFLKGGFREVLDRHSHIPRVMLTATPWRADGLGLGRIADVLVEGPSVDEMIGLGYLVPTRVFSRHVPDRSGLEQNSSGEFNERQLEALMSRPAIVGDCVKEWLYRANGRPTIVHAVNCAHSRAIVERFEAAGVHAVHIDASTPDTERKAAFDDMCAGAPAKTESLLLDLAGNVCHFGHPDDDRQWTLADRDPKEKMAAGLSIRRCEKCWFCFRSHVPKCPNCGNQYVTTQREIKEKKEALKEVARKKKEENKERLAADESKEERMAVFKRIMDQRYRSRHCKPGYYYHKYHGLTGHWPTKEMRELCESLLAQMR